MSLSHFDEKSGVITFKTSWGCWWQTVFEVHIIVNLPDNTKPRNVKVIINANDMECKVHDSILFKVELPTNYVINSSLVYVETIRCSWWINSGPSHRQYAIWFRSYFR